MTIPYRNIKTLCIYIK